MTDDQLIESLRARVAELEALPGNVLAREHEPFCWTTYPPSGRYSKCKAEVDLWERNSWTIVPLYARPVPDEPVNARLLDALKKCRDQLNAAISEAEKQPTEAGYEND